MYDVCGNPDAGATTRPSVPERRACGRWWLCGWVLAWVEFGLLLRFTYVHYALLDDVTLARSIAGFWGGAAIPFSTHIHTLLAYPLAGLYTLAPTVPWFGVAQAAMLLFASALVTKALMQLLARLAHPAWLGIPLSLLFQAAFLVEGSTSVTYTVTSAILASAAIMQLFAVDLAAPQGRARGLALSLVPILLGYLLRQVSALPALAIWLLAAAIRVCMLPGAARMRVLRQSRRFMLMVSVIGIGLVLVRQADIAWKNQQGLLRWQRARIQLTDFDQTNRLAPEDLAAVGWTPAELALYRTWYFWDANMDEATLTALHARYQALPAQEDHPGMLRGVWRAFLRLDATSEAFAHWWKAALLLAGLACLGALAAGERHVLGFAAPLLILLAAALLLGYLALQGRFPRRVAAVVLFPALAALYALALERFPRRCGTRTLLPAAAALVCVAVMAGAAQTAARYYINPTADNFPTAQEADVAYAAAHPGQLLFVDSTVPIPKALFAPTPRTANLIPLQSWDSRAPGMLATLAAFGLDGLDFSITALLGADVRLLSAQPAPQPELLAYLTERAGVPVVADAAGRAGSLYVIRLRAAQPVAAP